MLNHDLDNKIEQILTIQTIMDQKNMNELIDQQQVLIQGRQKDNENSKILDELNAKCQYLELELKNEKQSKEKLLEKNKIQQEKIQQQQEQDTKYIQQIQENIEEYEKLEEKNKQLEVKYKQMISEYEEKINKYEIQINKYSQDNQQLQFQLQEQKQQNKKNIKMGQDPCQINNNIQCDNIQFQMNKQNYTNLEQKLIEQLKIKDNIIYYLQNQLADFKVEQFLINQENSHNSKLNRKISEYKFENNIANCNNYKNLLTQTSYQSLTQSQKLNNKALPPRVDQKITQSQFNFQSEKQNYPQVSQIHQQNLEDLRVNNIFLSNLNESLTESPNQHSQIKKNFQ